jgi:hypothetical protein
MPENTIAEKVEGKLMLPRVQDLAVPQLQDLFVILSKEFTNLLSNCKDVDKLKELQTYLRSVATEIQRKQVK